MVEVRVVTASPPVAAALEDYEEAAHRWGVSMDFVDRLLQLHGPAQTPRSNITSLLVRDVLRSPLIQGVLRTESSKSGGDDDDPPVIGGAFSRRRPGPPVRAPRVITTSDSYIALHLTEPAEMIRQHPDGIFGVAAGQTVILAGLMARLEWIPLLSGSDDLLSQWLRGSYNEEYQWRRFMWPAMQNWCGELEAYLTLLGWKRITWRGHPAMYWAFHDAEVGPGLNALLDYLDRLERYEGQWVGATDRWITAINRSVVSGGEEDTVVAYNEKSEHTISAFLSDSDTDTVVGGGTTKQLAKAGKRSKVETVGKRSKMSKKPPTKPTQQVTSESGYSQPAQALWHRLRGRTLVVRRQDSYTAPFYDTPIGKAVAARLRTIEPYLDIPWVWREEAVYSLLHIWGLHAYYERAYCLAVGRLSPQLRQTYEAELRATEARLARMHQNRQMALRLQIDQRRHLYAERRYRWAYIRRYGLVRYQEHMGTLSLVDGGILRRHLSAKEQAAVITDLGVLDAWDAATRSAADSAQARTLRRHILEIHSGNTQAARWQAWERLRPFLPLADRGQKGRALRDTWYVSEGGLQLLCPHVVALLQLQQRDATRHEIDDVYRFYTSREYEQAGSRQMIDVYECRICGEPLRPTEEMTALVMVEGDMAFHYQEDPLENRLRQTVYSLTRSGLEFTEPRSSQYWSRLTSTLTKGLMPFVVLIEQRVRRNRTLTEPQVQDRVQVYLYMYCYANMLQIVLDHPTEVYLIGSEGRVPTRIEKMLEHAVERIRTQLSGPLSHQPEVDAEFLRGGVQSALRNLRVTYHGTVLGDDQGGVAFIQLYDPLLTEPAYWLSLAGRPVHWRPLEAAPKPAAKGVGESTKANGNKANGVKANGVKANGVKTKTKATKPISQRARAQDAKTTLLRRRAKAEQRTALKVLDVPATLRANDAWLQQQMQYWIQHSGSVKGLWVAHLESKLWGAYRQIAVLELLHRESVVAKAWPGLANLQYSRRLYLTRPRQPNPAIVTPDQYRPLEVNEYHTRLVWVYGTRVSTWKAVDGDGHTLAPKAGLHAHRWDLGVYVQLPSKSKPICYTERQRKAGVIPPTLILEEMRCSRCHHSMASLLEAPENLDRVLADAQEAIGFYTYYEIRCPETAGEPYHQFVDRKGVRICKQCGWIPAEDPDPAYLRKYLKEFRHLRDSASDVVKPTTKAKAKAKKDVEPRVLSGKVLPDLYHQLEERYAEPMKMKAQSLTRAIQYLGNTERYEYDQVLGAKVKPELTAERGPKLNSYIGILTREYVRLSHYQNLSDLPAEYRALVEGLPASEKLKPIYEVGPALHYNTWLTELRAGLGLTPEAVAEQQHYYLAGLLLAFIHMKGYQEWVMYLLGILLDNERITSRVSDSRASSLDATSTIVLLNITDAPNDAIYDDGGGGAAADGEDPGFSYEGMDYDGHNDAEKE
jgi:hypothetical protein